MSINEKEVKNRSGKDERNAYRKPCHVIINFAIESRAYMGIVKNISQSGAFIESLDTFPVGQVIKMAIPFSSERKGVKRDGIIRWSNQAGFGLKFAGVYNSGRV